MRKGIGEIKMPSFATETQGIVVAPKAFVVAVELVETPQQMKRLTRNHG